MTLPKAEVNQAWKRADGTTVLIEHAGQFGFFAAGTYYTGGQRDDRYHSPSGDARLDLVELVSKQPLEEIYEEGLKEFGEGKPVDSSKPTPPPLKVDQRWRRRDGKEVVVGWDETEKSFYVDGFFYFEDDDEESQRETPCHVAPCTTEGYDLVELLSSEPEPESSAVRDAYPRRLASFGYSDGVFCGLDEEGNAWYLRAGSMLWDKLPPLPNL